MYMRARGRVGRRSKGEVYIDPIYCQKFWRVAVEKSSRSRANGYNLYCLRTSRSRANGHNLYLFVQVLHYSDLSGFSQISTTLFSSTCRPSLLARCSLRSQ